MQYEDDYERRLAYIQRRRQERKRQYKIRMTVFFMVLGIVIIAACMLGWYFLEKKKYSKADDVISPTPARETPGNEPLETLGADPLEGTAGTAAEIILDEPASGIEQLLADAKALADTSTPSLIFFSILSLWTIKRPLTEMRMKRVTIRS